MKKSHIIILLSSFTFIFLVLGITFAILKSSNDEYLKSNPQIKNNDSDTYLGLSIIFFTLFVAGLGLSIYLIILGYIFFNSLYSFIIVCNVLISSK